MTEPRSIPFARPWITAEDRQAVLEVLEGHILTHGPQCQAFESEFAHYLGDGAHCVSVSSCMAALHLAYLYFGISRGDEVIVPAQTHTATVHAVEWVGATPVFVDCDPRTGNVEPASFEAAITPRTKAVSVVHFVGIPCEMAKIMEVARGHGLKVIEDCAIALGARSNGVHVGLFGDAGCFSFYPVKHITTGEGGMFVSRHREAAEAVGRLRAFGVDRGHGERSIPGMYDVPTLGLNYRMGEIQAALGRAQLKRFRENLARREVNFRELAKGVTGVLHVRVLDWLQEEVRNSHYCLSMVLEGPLAEHRNAVVAKLNAAGVGTSIYYPQPVPRMSYYRDKYGYDAGLFPQACAISDSSIALPVGPHLMPEDVSYIAHTVRTLLQEFSE